MDNITLNCIVFGTILLFAAMRIKYIQAHPKDSEEIEEIRYKNTMEENNEMKYNQDVPNYQQMQDENIFQLIMYLDNKQDEKAARAETQKSFTNLLLFFIVVELAILIYFAYYNYNIQKGVVDTVNGAYNYANEIMQQYY